MRDERLVRADDGIDRELVEPRGVGVGMGEHARASITESPSVFRLLGRIEKPVRLVNWRD